MKKLAIVVEMDGKSQEFRLRLLKQLRDQGLDVDAWLIETRHRWEDFKREFKQGTMLE